MRSRFQLPRKRLRSVAFIALLSLIVLTPLAIYLAKNPRFSQAAEQPWPQGYSGYLKRTRLNLTNTSADSLAANTTVSVNIDTKTLVSQNKLQTSCNDIRVVYQPDSSTSTQLTHHLSFSNNDTCAISEGTHIYFQLQAALGSGSSTADYYLYYSNPTAEAPSITAVDTFNLTSTTATFVCEYRAKTTCLTNSGVASATTATGAIRNNGIKNGLQFDGVNDYASAADHTSTSITGNLTLEVWVKPKKLSAEQTLIGKWDETTANDDRSYRLYITSGNKFAFSISTAGTSGTVTTITGSNTTIEKGAWYHVAGVYHATNQTLDLYVNGVSDNNQVGSAGTSISDNASNLYLGGKENTSGSIDTNFLGILDEARISSSIRYTGTFTPPSTALVTDAFTSALYHFGEGGNDPRETGTALDETDQNHATISGANYVTGFIGVDGPSEFGSHSGSNNTSVLEDEGASWTDNEWVGYIIYNATDASHGIITSNSANTLTATLSGGTDNDWDSGDFYTLSPDLGKVAAQSFANHHGIFIEEATTNKIDNPSFENTTYDTSWTEGTGTGIIITTTRVSAATSTGTQDITTSNLGGNTPKGVILIASYATTNGTARDNMSMSYGAATGASNEWSVSGSFTHGTTSNSGYEVAISRSTTDVIKIINPVDNTTLADASFDSFITNGVRIGWSSVDSVNPPLITAIFFAGSQVTATAGTAALGNTTDNEVDVNTIGFEPDLVFTGLSETTDDQIISNALSLSIGTARNNADTTETQRSIFMSHIEALSTSFLGISNFGVGQRLLGNGRIDYSVDIENFDDDGFSFFTRFNGGNSNSINYLALDLGSASTWVGTHTTPTSTGEYSETGPGFTPQFLFEITNFAENFADETSGANSYIYSNAVAGTFGFSAITEVEQFSNSFAVDIGNTTSDTQSLSDDNLVNLTNDDGSTGIVGNTPGDGAIFDSNGWDTDYTNVNAAGKLFLGTAVSSINYLTKSIETLTPYVKFGSRSSKIVATDGDSSLVNMVNPGNTNTHTLSVYAYLGTSGSEGGTIDNTIARIRFNGTDQSSTVYEDVGGGWWRLSYSAAAANAIGEYGVWIAEGETLYVDGFQLEEKAYATTYTDGSLGTGYTWSGTVNESASSRALADLDYPVAGNIAASAGSVSFWVKPNWAGDDNLEHTFFETDTSAGTFKLFKNTSNNLVLTDGTNNATKSISTWTKNQWHHVVATWGSGDLNVYTDNAAGTAAGAFSAPTLGTNLYIGQTKTNTNPANATIADLRIYDNVLTSGEITDIYYADLVSRSSQREVDAFTANKGQNPVAIWHLDEASGTIAHDATPFTNHLTVSGATWQVQSNTISTSRATSLSFDGSNDYAYLEPDTDFNFDTGSFTVSGWFKHAASVSGTDTILARYNSAGFKLYMNSSGYICLGLDDDSSYGPDDAACSQAQAGSFADSNWHHFAAVKNEATSITIYIDSIARATLPITATGSLNANARLYLGIDSDGTSNPWHGDLDDIVVYPYARTASQVQSDYFGSQVATSYGSPATDFLTQGLVGYWKMDEAGNTSRADSSGNGNTLSQSAGDTIDAASGKFGNSADFENSSSENETLDISDANQSGLDITESITVSAWIKPESLPAGLTTILGKWDSSNNRSFALWRVNNAIAFDISSNGVSYASAETGSILSTGIWHHIVGVYDGNRISIYINGSLSANGASNPLTYSSGIFNSTANFKIGGIDSGFYFDGAIDETRIYSRALSPAEVKALYEWAPGPHAYYPLDEGTGTTTVNDISGNNVSASMNGTMTLEDWVPGKFGYALEFDGGNYYVLGDPTDWTGPFTVGTWVKLNDSTPSEYQGVFSSTGNNTIASGFQIDIGGASDGCSGQFRFSGRNSAGTDNFFICFGSYDTEWHHLSVSFDGTTLSTYQDGVLQNTDTPSYGGNFTRYAIGTNRNSNNFFPGIIDDIKIYNYSRTSNQIVQDMNAGHPAPGSPVGSAYLHYKLDEGNQSTAYNSGNGGSSLNGSINSGIWSNEGKFGKAVAFTASTSITTTITDPGYTNTLSVWVYPTTTAASKTLITSGKLTTDGSSRPVYGGCTGTALSLNTWTHLVVVSNGSGSCAMYQNGVLSASGVTGVTFGTSVNIGGTSFTGIIDEVKLYNLAMTAQQVKTEYNQGFSQTLGATSTTSSGTPENSADFTYCPPGHSATCTPPVAEWKFDENTGTTVYDTSGHGNNGTFGTAGVGDPSWTTGKLGQATEYDGNDHIYVSTNYESVIEGSAKTITAWALSTGLGFDRRIFSIYNSSGTAAMSLHQGAGNTWRGSYRNAGGYVILDSSVPVTSGEWTHLAIVQDGTNVGIYVNGLLENSATDAVAPTVAAATNADIGAYDTNGLDNHLEFWSGKIDEIRMYDYARTPAQIAWDYNLGAPLAWWKFDECSGTNVNDSSGNNFTGTITAGDTSGSNDSVGTCSGSAGEMWADGATGKINASLELDGTNDHVDVTSSSSLGFESSTQDFSVFAWIKRTEYGEAHVVVEKRDSGIDGWSLIVQSSNLVNCTQDANLVSSTSTITDNQWHHVGCTIDRGGNMQMYIDGKPDGLPVAIGTSAMSITSDVRIGNNSYGTTRAFGGQIDDVRIYNYSLSPLQVKNLFNLGSAVSF